MDTYLYPSAEWVHEEIGKLVEQDSYGRDSVNDTLESDLEDIGFWDSHRVVDQPLDNRVSVPLDLYFDYTFACNLKCPFCYNKDDIDTPDNAITMSDEKVQQVLENMYDNGIMRTHLAGGEPLIDPDALENYLSTAKELGINSSIVTNGTMFDEQRRNILFENDLISLTFSLDSPIPETHDEIRGDGVFDRTTQAVREAVEHKQRVGADTRIQIKMSWIPVVPHEHFDQMIELGIDLGADVVQFHNPERSIDHKKDHYKDHMDEYYDRIQYIDDLEDEYDEVDVWNVWNPIAGCKSIGLPNMRGCVGAQELLAINPDGRIMPCLMNKHTLGELFQDWDGALDKFWRESEELKKFQGVIQELPEICDSCDLLDECRGGSTTRKIVGNKEYDEELELDHMQGAGSFCLKRSDFYDEAVGAVENSESSDLHTFDEIHVAHSL
jgi:radical SAM protein with 4Fe4S-binding SPASM domain